MSPPGVATLLVACAPPAQPATGADECFPVPRRTDRRVCSATLRRALAGARRPHLRPRWSAGWDHRLGRCPLWHLFFDLPSLAFGTFGGSKPLLRTFLDAYGWPVEADFAHRAMTMTLVHEFNPLGHAMPPVEDVTTLDELAEMLWRV